MMHELVTEWALTILMSLLSLAAAYAVLFLKKAREKAMVQIGKLNEEKQQNLLREAIAELDALAETTVGAIEQTMAKELRVLVKAGQADRRQLLNLAPKAFGAVVANMKPEYFETLEKNMANIESYIQDVIENKVLEVKTLTLEEEAVETEENADLETSEEQDV